MTVRPEVWISALGYEGIYDVSNHGRVRNAAGETLAPASARYPHLTLCRDGERQTVRVHVLVLSSFCGPRPFPEADACHNDGDSQHIHLTNLRWGTKRDNQADSIRHGTRPKGVDVYGAKLDEEKVRAIKRALASKRKGVDIAEAFGVSPSTVHLIKTGRVWKWVTSETTV